MNVRGVTRAVILLKTAQEVDLLANVCKGSNAFIRAMVERKTEEPNVLADLRLAERARNELTVASQRDACASVAEAVLSAIYSPQELAEARMVLMLEKCSAAGKVDP